MNFDYLPDDRKMQLLHCRPELRIINCTVEHCGGQVLESYGERKCLLCGAEYDDRGELICPHTHYG